ncbi:MAG: nucleotide exchange factor GrpE [Coriobacteriia bacterium]
MDRKHKGIGGGDPVCGSSEQPSAAPAERARSGRHAGATPTDPELEADLGAEFEFRGDQLEGELETARREAAAHLDTAQRIQADFDNYRKRMAREQEEACKRANQRLITYLLPVVDNLERALAHAPADDPLNEGVRMVLQQMLDVFAKEGVERIEPEGEVFDPTQHQAVGQAERPDVPDSTCVEVYQQGFRMHGRVLRPASVVVSCGGPARQE